MCGKSPTKRLRVQGPRSSLGCQTCKARRVKCDELKPQCQRCLKADRLCHYANDASHSQLARSFIVYSVPASPHDQPDLGTSGRRALHHYRTRTAWAIAYPFGCELWSTVAIQLSEEYDFVMSALVALSSMHEQYLQPSSLQPSHQADGIRHYNKAIRAIVELESEQSSIDAILVSCIMFCAIESLRGSWTQALQHALSGMQIIGERRQGRPNESTIPTRVLDEAFLALQIQVMELGAQEEARVYKPSGDLQPHVPTKFACVDEALYHLHIIYNESSCLLDTLRAEQTTGNNENIGVPTDLQQQLAFLKTRLDRWGHAMENFQSSADANPYSQQFHAILIMNMYCTGFQCALDGLFKNTTTDSSAVLDHADRFIDSQDQGSDMIKHNPSCSAVLDQDMRKHTSNYSTVLDQAEAFFEYQSRTTEMGNRTYSMSLGAMPMLFMLATHDDPSLRQRSLAILHAHDRREGPWDSKVVIRLAQKVTAKKSELRMLYGDEACVSILYMRFVDDDTCQITYGVSFAGPDARGDSWPGVSVSEGLSCTQIDVVDVGSK